MEVGINLLHLGGQFVSDTQVEYVRGEVNVWPDIDIDKFSITELEWLYEKHYRKKSNCQIFWLAHGSNLVDGLRLLENDEDVHVLYAEVPSVERRTEIEFFFMDKNEVVVVESENKTNVDAKSGKVAANVEVEARFDLDVELAVAAYFFDWDGEDDSDSAYTPEAEDNVDEDRSDQDGGASKSLEDVAGYSGQAAGSSRNFANSSGHKHKWRVYNASVNNSREYEAEEVERVQEVRERSCCSNLTRIRIFI
ncbi:hypothetical protein CRG98_028707 [Punica granatum]|uniref:PB1-like domain-containing protein n=1 Tax=Punica granatum TaxID=22663 RepID=A0A2I0J3T9_PUNGR|nr:hypothetical protein CRG98_028707 [Punica granatum]